LLLRQSEQEKQSNFYKYLYTKNFIGRETWLFGAVKTLLAI